MPLEHHRPRPAEEANEIAAVLRASLPRHLDGRAAIQEMKDGGWHQWRQMEWIGWYYEWKLGELLRAGLGGGPGPRYGNTVFDYRRNHVWDFKAHPFLNPNGQPNEPMILNDQEAVQRCLTEHGGLGFVVVNGVAGFDGGDEFKTWHDEIKGGPSDYERARVARGAPSRRRKTSFTVQEIEFYFFVKKDEIERGLAEGWLGAFQEGMRNADGSPRRAKYSIFTNLVPAWVHPIAKVRL